MPAVRYFPDSMSRLLNYPLSPQKFIGQPRASHHDLSYSFKAYYYVPKPCPLYKFLFYYFFCVVNREIAHATLATFT